MSRLVPALSAPETGIDVRIRGELDGPILAIVPVQIEDLRDAISELRWHSGPRRGSPGFAAEDASIWLQLIAGDGIQGTCRGFLLRTLDAAGLEVRLAYGSAALQHLAQRAAEDLRTRGLLGETGTYYYELSRQLDAPEEVSLLSPGRDLEPSSSVGQVLTRTVDLQFTQLDLRALLENSVNHGESDDEHHLFYTDRAMARAEAIARRGEEHEPPVETGGVLLGLTGYCSSLRDAFVIVVDALAAVDAEQSQFSLSFSGKTWQRLQTVVRARRSEPGQAGLRIVGQTHGHPFSPGEPCAACPSTEDCPKHTAYLSEDDRLWSRAVFASQAFQVGHMFGIDAKGQAVSSLYGLRGGRIDQRGYRAIDNEAFQQIHMQQTAQTDGDKR